MKPSGSARPRIIHQWKTGAKTRRGDATECQRLGLYGRGSFLALRALPPLGGGFAVLSADAVAGRRFRLAWSEGSRPDLRRGDSPRRFAPSPTGRRPLLGTELHLDKAPNAIFLGRDVVAYVDSRIGGGWFARLEVQRPFEAPVVTRPCTDLAIGRRGCELWVCRHEARLRREVAEAQARRASRRWCARA